MQSRSLSVAFAVILTYSVSLILPSMAAKTHPPRRVVKHTAKHTAAAHPAVVGGGQGGGVPDRTPEEMQELSGRLNTLDNSIVLSKQGDVAIKGGNWAQAQTYYQQALEVWPDNSNAFYGLGKCADAAGDTASAISYYRKVIYTKDPHRYGTVLGDGFGTNDVAQLMEFVLLLNKAGQQQEALAVYRRAAYLLNYQDADTNGGKPYLDVLLPEFGNSPSEWAFTPQRMEAMAYVGHAYRREDFDHKLAQVELQKAIDLAPDSPVPYFYKGRSIIKATGHRREALNDFQTAAQLGGDDTKAAAEKGMKEWGVERDATAEQNMEDLQRKEAAKKK